MKKVIENKNNKEETVIELYDKDGNRVIDLVSVLLDENNQDTIMIEDNMGNVHEFEQLAIINYENEKYAILKNYLTEENKDNNEIILIFRICESLENRGIFIVDDENLALTILEDYKKN